MLDGTGVFRLGVEWSQLNHRILAFLCLLHLNEVPALLQEPQDVAAERSLIYRAVGGAVPVKELSLQPNEVRPAPLAKQPRGKEWRAARDGGVRLLFGPLGVEQRK